MTKWLADISLVLIEKNVEILDLQGGHFHSEKINGISFVNCGTDQSLYSFLWDGHKTFKIHIYNFFFFFIQQ